MFSRLSGSKCPRFLVVGTLLFALCYFFATVHAERFISLHGIIAHIYALTALSVELGFALMLNR